MISKEYYGKKLNNTSIDDIDWESRQVAFDILPKHLYKWASKSASNFCSTSY